MFDGRFRHAVDRSTSPVGRALVRLRVTANVLTVLGLCMSVVTAVLVGRGDFAWGIVAMVATGASDLLDGPVAKASGTASVRGAFLDSVADRASDAFLYGGLAWYLAAHHHGTAVLIPFAIVAATGLISYERAKAELLGMAAKGGLMERAERFIVLGLCLLAAAVDPVTLVPALTVFLVLVLGTAAGRFAKVWRTAPPAPQPVRPEPAPHALRHAAGRRAAARHTPTRRSTGRAVPGSAAGEPVGAAVRWRPGRVDSRWRAWRAARASHLVDGRPGAAERAADRRGLTGAVSPRPASPRTSELAARWRARRAGVPASRVGRLWRDRAGGARPGAGRRPSAGSR